MRKKILAMSLLGTFAVLSVAHAGESVSYNVVNGTGALEVTGFTKKKFPEELVDWVKINKSIVIDNISIDNATKVLNVEGTKTFKFVLGNGAKFKSGVIYTLENRSGGQNVSCSLTDGGSSITCQSSQNGSLLDNMTLKSNSANDNITVRLGGTGETKLSLELYTSGKVTNDNATVLAKSYPLVMHDFDNTTIKATIDVKQRREEFVVGSDNNTYVTFDNASDFGTADNLCPQSANLIATYKIKQGDGFKFQIDDNVSDQNGALVDFVCSNGECSKTLTYTFDNNCSATMDKTQIAVVPTGVMRPGKYELTTELKLKVGNDEYPVSYTTKPIFDISINGAQFVVPYMYFNTLNYVRITNDSDQDAEITADLVDDAGVEVKNVNLGTVRAKGARVINAQVITTEAKKINSSFAASNSYGTFRAKFTVAAEAKDVTAIAYSRFNSTMQEKRVPVFKLTKDSNNNEFYSE